MCVHTTYVCVCFCVCAVMYVFTCCIGTSDEHITVVENVQNLNPDGVILVSTPQVSVLCVRCKNICYV